MEILNQYAGEILKLDQLYMFIVAAAGILLAFLAFKLLRIELLAAGAGVGYYLGSTLLAPALADTLKLNIDLALILGIVCAVIGGLICLFARKFAILVGAGVGAYLLLKAVLPTYLGSMNATLQIVICVVAAIVCAFIIRALFKLLFVIVTSFGCMTIATTTLFYAITGGYNLHLVAAIVGLVLGLIAMISQFKHNSKKI